MLGDEIQQKKSNISPLGELGGYKGVALDLNPRSHVALDRISTLAQPQFPHL